jgi:DICT domain-containing protein
VLGCPEWEEVIFMETGDQQNRQWQPGSSGSSGDLGTPPLFGKGLMDTVNPTLRQQIDLGQPPQGQEARIYRYFHQLVQQMEQQSRQLQESDLGSLALGAGRRHDVSFFTYTQPLVMVSHAIEDEFIQKRLAQPFYVGVQYFSRLLPQEPRYRAILRSAQRVMVFGLDDVPLWNEPRFERVTLDLRLGTGLERFWIVTTRGPLWETALLAEHLEGDFSTALAGRRYKGFWTFDPLIVERIVGTLDYAAALMTGARQG